MGLNIPGLLKSTGSWLMAAAMMLSACTTELASDSRTTANGKQEELVTLKLLVPGAADAGKKGFTRTLDEETEKKIEDLYILAFKQEETGSETFQYFTKARSSEGNTQWETSLHVETYQQTFVVIANADGTAGDKEISLAEKIISLEQGTGKDEILKQLTVELTQNEKTSGFNAESDHDHRPFTMYGQTKATITGKTGIELKVSLHRIMGRIQLYFGKDGDGLEDFTPEAVYLYNFNDRASVLPENLEDTGTDYVQSPTIPEGVSRIKGPVEYEIEPSANKLERSIYLFETRQPETTDVSAHTKRTCLVVKGKYQDKESSYYRVDLAKPDENGGTELDYLDVLRNHSYNITVTSVSGQGHGTEEEAFQAKAANITANIVVWNDTEIGNVDFDGENFLGIGTMEYRVGKIKATHVQKVKASKGLEWSVELLEVDASGKVQEKVPDWINFEGESNASGIGKGEIENLAFNVETFSQSTGERQAVMRFTAGNLKLDALIIQDTSNPVFISVDEDILRNGIEYLEQGGFNEPLKISYGPKDVTLEWKILTAGGMEFSGTMIDGKQQTDPLAGETTPTTAEEGSYITWKGEAKKLNTEKDYETKTATLTLIAKNQTGDEIAAKTVKLYQKKYGVTIDKNSITCSGKQAKIRVKGNMDWNVTMTNDDGAVNDGWIQVFDQTQTGYASENYTSNTDNTIDIETVLLSDFSDETKALTLSFTDRKNEDRTYDKTVTIRKGLMINGAPHEILGPVEVRLDEALMNYPYSVIIGDPSNAYKKATFPDEETAKLITRALGGTCWTTTSKIVPTNIIGETNNSYYPHLIYDNKFDTTLGDIKESFKIKYIYIKDGEITETDCTMPITLSSTESGDRIQIAWSDMETTDYGWSPLPNLAMISTKKGYNLTWDVFNSNKSLVRYDSYGNPQHEGTSNSVWGYSNNVKWRRPKQWNEYLADLYVNDAWTSYCHAFIFYRMDETIKISTYYINPIE